MEHWKEIKDAIYDALDDYDCDVYYQPPTGCGYGAHCAYFEITINEDYDCEDIENDLNEVCNDYELGIDWDSDEDVDLNAYWDIND